MTKKTIKRRLDNSDWVNDLGGMDVLSAICWLQQKDLTGILHYHAQNYYVDSDIEIVRIETDEEESAREAVEAKAAATRLQKENAEILRRASILEMTQMENIVLAEYLAKHKNNPRINDLENLNRALFKMPDTGYNGETIQMVKDCIREIEKGTV